MTERPKWMPSDEAIRACSAVDHVESANMKMYVVTATGALLHKTGLRAQIAVLESLIEGQTGHMVDRAKKMIEEIRKELGA